MYGLANWKETIYKCTCPKKPIAVDNLKAYLNGEALNVVNLDRD